MHTVSMHHAHASRHAPQWVRARGTEAHARTPPPLPARMLTVNLTIAVVETSGCRHAVTASFAPSHAQAHPHLRPPA